MTYPYPSGLNKSVDMLTWMNEVVNWFGLGLLLMIFSIAFISTLRFGMKRAFAVASWLSFLSCLLLWVITITTARELFITVIMVGTSVVWLWLGKD